MKAKNGAKKMVQMFKPQTHKPFIMERNMTVVEGPRYAYRPCKLARKANVFNGTQVQWADRYDPPSDWSDDEELPAEARLEDCSWRAGPSYRELPQFHGPTPGPTDSSLTASCSVQRFLDSQLTHEFRLKTVQFTIAHCLRYRAEHTNWRTDCIERSMRRPKSRFTVASFNVWLACRLRLAQLKPEINSYSLWNRHCSLFDVQVFNAITFNQYQWVNRHLSFADLQAEPTSDDEDEESEEESEHEACDSEEEEDSSDPDEHNERASKSTTRDPHRKRRELTNLACAAFANAWNPHQYVGVDEAVRSHKHWGKQRIRFKASVHSGSLVDSLNDCETKYCIWFEEHRWLRRSSAEEEDPNDVASRLVRAASVLCDKDDQGNRTHVSTSNYCMTLDRGYGHVEAQHCLAAMGVYTNSVMVLNRTGLPRNYLRELATDLSDCGQIRVNNKWVECTHDVTVSDCRRFSYTCLHKHSHQPQATGAAGADWELALWQDSQLIICLSNFFSTSRCGFLSRGSSHSSANFSVWAPEAIWHYNMQGRSATDGSDQLRKKLCVAERRIVRAGVKGISFVFDLGITNAFIMWHFLNRPLVKNRAELDLKFSKVSTTAIVVHVAPLTACSLACR